jgi:cysteine desulfuration protein SufE
VILPGQLREARTRATLRALVLTQQTIESRTLLEKEQQLVAVLLEVRNPQQRLAMIVEHARKRPPLDAALRVEANRVQGCLVRTWFVAELRAGKCVFSTDSDAVMLKALLGLVCDLYSGFTPEEIATSSPDVLQQLGVLHQLAENRSRTVLRVAEQIQEFARQQLQLAA